MILPTKKSSWTAVKKKNFSTQLSIVSLPAFILNPRVGLGIADSAGDVFTQTMTYSGDQYNARSLKLEVPQHQGGETAFDQLAVVMHAATNGYWHYSSLKVENRSRLNIYALSSAYPGQHALQEGQPLLHHHHSQRLLPSGWSTGHEGDCGCA